MKTRRVAPGEYVITDGVRAVTISRYTWLPLSGPQWVARSEQAVTDPLWTLAEAVAQAAHLLSENSDG